MSDGDDDRDLGWEGVGTPPRVWGNDGTRVRTEAEIGKGRHGPGTMEEEGRK